MQGNYDEFRFELKTMVTKVFQFCLMLLCCSCLTPVEISFKGMDEKLVVYGQISTIEEQNIVQIGTTNGTESLPVPLQAATVTLFDGTGKTYLYSEDPLSPGTYLLTGTTGIAGGIYRIQIVLPSRKIYESAVEKLPETSGEMSSNFSIVREQFVDFEGVVADQPFIKIYINSNLPSSEPGNFKWLTEETYLLTPTDTPDIFRTIPPPCFIQQNADPQHVVLFNGSDLHTTSLDNFLVASRIIDWTFLEKHYFTTYQTAITKEAYDYWRKVDIVANQSGSIFDTPPAPITGNIHNVNDPSEKVLGYFQSVNQTLNRIVIYPSDLGFPLIVKDCNYDPNRKKSTYPERCWDCLSIRNSSYRRPDWF